MMGIKPLLIKLNGSLVRNWLQEKPNQREITEQNQMPEPAIVTKRCASSDTVSLSLLISKYLSFINWVMISSPKFNWKNSVLVYSVHPCEGECKARETSSPY
ncbi:hypothetical protein DAPPUDRAFT_235886 [Daphnia pulex]|uniref:Uncharacterized protein n=1 Tax=Daphnia pulex TaxID=6669 RepID=E9FZB3_DAPPU|nr:hypothetical protein DAPPUDRAFT_235886 [Daphnia pulex]|eukprot:EFX87294.1 hypothetical protein DAPPUDRAFT_235886 [Daphnia pulex]